MCLRITLIFCVYYKLSQHKIDGGGIQQIIRRWECDKVYPIDRIQISSFIHQLLKVKRLFRKAWFGAVGCGAIPDECRKPIGADEQWP